MRGFDTEGKEFLFKVIRWGLSRRPGRGDKVNVLGWEMAYAEPCGEPEQPAQPAGWAGVEALHRLTPGDWAEPECEDVGINHSRSCCPSCVPGWWGQWQEEEGMTQHPRGS